MTRRAIVALLLLSFFTCPSRADEVVIVSPKVSGEVRDLRGRSLEDAQARAGVDSLSVSPAQRNLRQHSTVSIGKGDFHLRATVVCDEFAGRGAAITFDGGTVVLDDREWGAVLMGRLFGGGRFPFESDRPANAVAGAPMTVEIQRIDGQMSVRINEFPMGTIGIKDFVFGRVGFDLAAGAMRVLECSVEGDVSRCERPTALFSAADGDIDEYRDPSVASSGAIAIATAVAVTTTDDGGTRTALWARPLGADGVAAAPYRIDLGDLEPDLAVLGFAAGAARPWMLLVQEQSAKHLVERVVVFDSADGRSFERRGEVASAGSPLQLASGALWSAGTQTGGPALAAGATRLVEGKPRASLLEMTPDGTWSIRDLSAEPGCEPSWLGGTSVLVRTPKSLARSVVRDSARAAADGYESAATMPAVIGAAGSTLRLVQAEPGFPYPLRELVSSDGGAKWKATGTLWGAAAGHAVSAVLAGDTVVVFEGGDRARREHVLCVTLRRDPPAPATR